jgi:hypothetical protein
VGIYTGFRKKRGDKARRPNLLTSARVLTTKTTEVLTFRVTGEHEADSTMPGSLSQTTKVVLPTVEPVEVRTIRKPGKRIHKGPQSLNHGSFWIAPCFATKVVPGKATTKAKAPRPHGKGYSVSIGEDGCTNISVRGHLSRFGYTAKNKHTKPVPATEFSPGKVVNNNLFELANITLEKSGRLFTATATVWNPESKVHKRIMVPRVRNKKEAIVALRTIHQIDC